MTALPVAGDNPGFTGESLTWLLTLASIALTLFLVHRVEPKVFPDAGQFSLKFPQACWVCVKRGRPTDDGTFWYLNAVEEALCFGWIDSHQKPINGVLMQCFTPRKAPFFCKKKFFTSFAIYFFLFLHRERYK